jgi:SAM-dependent methyltransferase
MSCLTDRSHLDHQYRDSFNLDARVALHQRFSMNPYGFYPWYLDQLDVPANARILEAGAGSGALWQEVAERIPPGWQITLTDLSAGMLATAERNLAPIRPFTFVQADAQEIPFPHETFDAVLANHMLYHVPDRPRALAEFQRVLKPGGHLYAATNGPGHLKELRDLLAAYVEQMPLKGGIGFGLDDGAEQLAPYFEHIELHRYHDAFHVTEAEPLRAYIRSMSDQWPIPVERRAMLDRRIDEMIPEGPIHIGKEAGMFTARRAVNQTT